MLRGYSPVGSAEPGGVGCPQCQAGSSQDWSDTSLSLLVILAKYGLDGRKDARAVSSNSLSDATEDDSLEDPRLEKLWHKVTLTASHKP